jgi:hypothetical protein
MFHKVEGTGLYGRIPTPNGGSLVEVAIGDMTITSGILRGGAVYEDNGSKGGTFGSVSLGRRTYMATTPAVNEGYVAEIFTSPDADPQTKQMLAQYLMSQTLPEPKASATSAVNAATATGSESSVSENLNPTRTGFDNVVDTVGETAPKIVEPIADATSTVVEKTATATTDVVNKVSETANNMTDNVTEVSKDWSTVAKWVVVAAVVIVILTSLVLVGVWVIRNRHKQALQKLIERNDK